jgi:hypothetical protein
MSAFKIGGYAAFAQTLISILNLVLGVVVLPMMGFREMADLADPARALSLKTPLLVLELLKLVAAIALVLIILSAGRRLRVHAPTLNVISMAAGLIGTALLLLAGVIGIITLNASAAPAASTAGVINLIGLSAVALVGAWALLASIIALRANIWHKRLNWLGVGLGVVSLPVILFPPLALLPLILGLIWYPWLGRTLLQIA